MSRAYGEPVNVQARNDGRPVRFVWQGRLYTVRAILEHWIINHEWWQDREPSRPVEAPPSEPGPPEPRQPEPPPPEPRPPEPPPPEPPPPEPPPPELEFWRVEAAPGQGTAAGIYELRRDAATNAWTLRLSVE